MKWLKRNNSTSTRLYHSAARSSLQTIGRDRKELFRKEKVKTLTSLRKKVNNEPPPPIVKSLTDIVEIMSKLVAVQYMY